ncbi:MAG TPA: hypothetical protein VFO77_12000, partial [Actinoplanes sp.]|nr:hypothetical protein [Actinoplanes sp.]
MTLERSKTDEPLLAVRPALRFWTREFTRRFLTAVGIAAIGLASLFVSGNLLLPFQSPLVLEGETASKGAIFSDDKVRQLLLKEHIRVRVTQMGSREMATHDLSSYDFAFPSGQPAADKIIKRLSAGGRLPRVSRPFTSPLVLATFRQFAETLVANKVATR